MKSITLSYLFTATLLMAGCQSFQFVESPIPVKNAPSKNTLVTVAEAVNIVNEK